MKKFKRRWLFSALIAPILFGGFNNCSGSGSGASSNASSSSSNGSTNPGGSVSSLPAGETFYNNDVIPVFDAQCMTCHNDPRFGGQGPLTIYTYTSAKAILAVGPSSVNNNLINTMQNIIPHNGGNVCPNGLSVSPCLDVINWWQQEYTTSASGVVGVIQAIDILGNVTGWAQDSNNPTNTITVYFYVGGGPTSGGTAAGSVTANLTGTGSNTGHYFAFALPSQFCNGTAQSLYAYGITAADANLLPGAPQPFTSYTPTQAGMNYYANTLEPLLMNKCSACHEIDYPTQYQYLASPPPSAGGTATTNLLIEKPAGVVSHGGGNICGSISGSPCAEIQQWWTLEFN